MKKLNKSVIIPLLTATASLLPAAAFAQTIDNLIIRGGDVDTLKSIIISVALWVAGLAGSIALIYLIWGGVTYMTGGEKGAANGKTMITNAIIGIAIIALSVIIVNAVVNLLSGN
jgi:hypothetical protein